MENISISLFKGYRDTCPTETELSAIAVMIRQDAATARHTEKYRYYRQQQQNKAAQAEKSNCPCFAVAVRFKDGKNKEHIDGYTGLCLADFDHIDAGEMPRCLQLICQDPHTLMAYTTISGTGIRVISRYTILNPDCCYSHVRLYTEAFTQMNRYYADLTGLSYDEKCKNMTRLSGLAHDPDVWFCPDAVPFEVTGKAISATPARQSKNIRRLQQAVKEIEQRLAHEGIEYAEHHHNEYIMRTGYLLNAYGISQQVATEWGLQRFADYEGDVAGIFRSCYQQTDEHGTLMLKSRKTQNSMETVAEIEDFLTGLGHFRKNIITGKYEMAAKDEESFQELTDRHVNSLWRKMCKERKKVKVTEIRNVIESDFTRTFNPFQEYLDNLPAWDGVTDHIGQLAAQVHIKTGAELFPAFFKKWLVAMIASLLDEQVVNHEILVFIGRQGIYKSTWLNNLLPPELRRYFYLKSNSRNISKDDMLTLSEFAVICLEELDEMNDRELNQLKALTTTFNINERAAYAHYKENRPHIASLCGTGNNLHFLTDLTGNRRWMPFEVDSIDNPYEHPLNYRDIYAQARDLANGGFRYWLEQEEIILLNEHNRYFEVPCLEQDLILTYYQVPRPGEPGVFLTNAQILQRLNTGIHQKLSPVKIGLVMKQIGFPSARVGGKRGYRVIELTGEEIEQRKRSMAVFMTEPETQTGKTDREGFLPLYS